jgi:FixJ family two-component response regulator
MTKVSIISIVDDDQSVRESLHGLLRSVGFSVQVFVSAEEFLQSGHLDKTDCLILDVRMPGITGLELQRQLRAQGCQIPIIFISAHADDETRGQALGGGAVAFLIKPLNEDMVLTALKTALGT